MPTLRVLVLEDDERDAEIIAETLLRTNPRYTVQCVDSEGAFTRALDVFKPDVVLSDHAVADFNSLDALRVTQLQRPECAFLLVSGAFERDSGECLKAGAADYVSKSDLSGLNTAIRMAVALRMPLRKLTRRHWQVLKLLVAGRSTREIADHLRIHVKTAEAHRAQVLKRLEIHDVVELVHYAIRTGIAPALLVLGLDIVRILLA